MKSTRRWAVPAGLVGWFAIVFAFASDSGIDIAERGKVSTSQVVVGHQRDMAPLDRTLLPNAFWVHSDLISGGRPAGPEAFGMLRQIGVQTVVSVDGVIPDTEAARSHGLRYVHLPLGYDGISQNQAEKLACAFLKLPAPIYIHCHHGRHRSPAAAAAGSVKAGLIDSVQALQVMRQAGTSRNYAGLWAGVQKVQRGKSAELRSMNVNFVEAVDPPPLVESMAMLETTMEDLERAVETARTRPPTSKVDLRHDALLLRECFAEMQRLESVQNRSEDFGKLLAQSQDEAARLHRFLTHQQLTSQRDKLLDERVSPILTRVRALCRDCHRQFRDD